MRRFREKVASVVKRILAANATPHEVALGLAVGMFVAFLPLVPFQTGVLVALLLLLRRCNKIAAVSASWVMNYLTIAPIYLLLYWLGSQVYETGVVVEAEMFTEISVEDFLALGANIFVPLMIGGLIAGTGAALLTYVFFWQLLSRREQRRKNANPEAVAALEPLRDGQEGFERTHS